MCNQFICCKGVVLCNVRNMSILLEKIFMKNCVGGRYRHINVEIYFYTYYVLSLIHYHALLDTSVLPRTKLMVNKNKI